ncbi:MAG: Coenzyme F420 hydrogenase/dehydrogenase, beta subunit C-terminal domain [Phycisphaerae bacterium]|nr:Coenzyme F420 hydrogenase/dehydrogenase, beta subunit C-terminal domain [Phycisphaerae bacterium]
MLGRSKVKNIKDVAEYQLCCGCGACAYISPDEIRMVDAVDYGRRPYFANGGPAAPQSAEAMRVCPGIELSHTFDRGDPGLIRELLEAWGPIREVWEGHAADPEIRFAGSSGGVATALALYCLDHAGFYGVLHTRARRDVPYLNETVLSRTREELLAGAGSRYAPASPCDGLKTIEDAPGPCVFIGKPCDVAAVQKARCLRPALDAKLGLTVAFFCAGTPSTAGTLQMLRAMGVADLASVVSVRYRGNGWPGKAVVQFRLNGKTETRELTYEQSWGEVLQKFRQWRCYICPDHSGEFADVAVGDAWHRTNREDDPGHSVILARTNRGHRLLHDAIRTGRLTVDKAAMGVVPSSQPGFQVVRGALWGRLLTLRLLDAPAPRYVDMPLFSSWLRRLSLKQKLRSGVGTIKRVKIKRLRRRHAYQP